MKFLVATKQTQGQRDNDFSFLPDGEPVFFGFVCSRDAREGPDGGCGCNRCFTGVNTLTGTTTALVVEVDDAGVSSIANALSDYFMQFLGNKNSSISRAYAMILDVSDMAEPFVLGTVVEKRGEYVVPRHNSTDNARITREDVIEAKLKQGKDLSD